MSARMPGWVQRLQRSTLAFPLAVLLGLAMLLVSELAYRGAIDQLENLLRLAHARMDTFVLLRRLTDAETYQRGYLITGHPQDRVRHQEAAADAAQRMLRLDSDLTTLGYTVKLHSRQRFLEAGERRLEEMREVVRLFDSGERSSAIELVRSGIGQDYMQQVRDSADELIEVQNRHIRASLASTMDTLLASRLGIAGLTAACLGILGLFLHQSRLMARRQTEQKQALREERDRLEAEVQHRTRELTELARHLVNAREDERARLARDLHDELGALLTAAKLDVARIRPQLQKALPDAVPRLNHLIDTLNEGIALKRRIIEDLRPSTLDNLGLQAALEVLCADVAQRLGVPIAAQIAPVALARGAELTVFRMVQEALTNIAKHAHATTVQVRLQAQDDCVLVEVEDNGVGFVPHATGKASHGLTGMHYRVEAEGGSMSLHSQPGHGTRLVARLPRKTDAAALAPDAASGAAAPTGAL